MEGERFASMVELRRSPAVFVVSQRSFEPSFIARCSRPLHPEGRQTRKHAPADPSEAEPLLAIRLLTSLPKPHSQESNASLATLASPSRICDALRDLATTNPPSKVICALADRGDERETCDGDAFTLLRVRSPSLDSCLSRGFPKLL